MSIKIYLLHSDKGGGGSKTRISKVEKYIKPRKKLF